MMKSAIYRGLAGAIGLSFGAIAPAALAEPPGVYYSWREITTNVDQCLAQAKQALESQSLITVQADETSVAGRSEEATAVFICLQNPASTTVMVVVASDDDEQALTLREALKQAF